MDLIREFHALLGWILFFVFLAPLPHKFTFEKLSYIRDLHVSWDWCEFWLRISLVKNKIISITISIRIKLKFFVYIAGIVFVIVPNAFCY